jgi:hypothetical protein
MGLSESRNKEKSRIYIEVALKGRYTSTKGAALREAALRESNIFSPET